MFKRYLLIVLMIIPFYTAKASIIITNVDKEVKFTDYGKEVSVRIIGKTKLENKKYYYNEWGYIFGPTSNVEIVNASVGKRRFKTEFSKKQNILKFSFDNAFNNEILEFNFKYKIYNDSLKNIKYTRDEYVAIAPFMKGANANIKIHLPKDWVLYSRNKDFKEVKYNTSYMWTGIISEDGFIEKFALTLKKAKWKVTMKNIIIGSDEFKDLDMSVPLYFKGGNHIVEEFDVKTNKDNSEVTLDEEKDVIIAEFKNLDSRLAQVNVSATIKNGDNGYYWVSSLHPSDFSDVSLKTASVLSEKIGEINREDGDADYISIAKWVHNYIKYDESYVGLEKGISEILQEKRGVCVHYSLLYEKMLRTIGIPATAVSGLSYNNKKGKFEQHSWVLVYINGGWVPIDPTWGVYSGKLPISHIFTYKNTDSFLGYKVYDYSDMNSVSATIKEEVEFLE